MMNVQLPIDTQWYRRAFLPTALGIVLLGAWSAPSLAFHDQGVAACAGCHIMHASEDGMVVMGVSGPLLAAASATDLCLMCHGGDQGVFSPQPLDPAPEKGGGNFTFLLEDNLNDGPGGAFAPIHGDAAGHNIISLDRGVQADPNWTFSPGGNFPVDKLGCTSCHDPHGNTNFRMLHGVGPIQGGIFTFTNAAPVAIGLDPADPDVTEEVDSHTAYISGMSDWCSNCHGRYHDTVGNENFSHRFNRNVSGTKAQRYNQYNGEDDPVGGSQPFSYIPEVPFEDTEATVTSTAGPNPWSTIMCLTCHRAHASSAPRAGRWDFGVQYLLSDGLESGSYPIPSPYMSPMQTSLCFKCHGVTEAIPLPFME